MRVPEFERFCGVDFSGARLAGDAIWVAEVVPDGGTLRLDKLRCLTAICGTNARAEAHAALVRLVLASERTLWGFDFPFGLPVELFPAGTAWTEQFEFLRAWPDDAYGCGLECVRRATEMLSRKHVMRATEAESKTPFDPYHYRIIYQTYYGMRDVVDPLRQSVGTCVLPFQYRKLARAKRVVVECCPGSVLKRSRVPYQNYKQPAGGALTKRRLTTRHTILDWLSGLVTIEARYRRAMMRNPGGDAIDAVIAAVGSALAVPRADHARIARHARYRREGRLFV